MKISDFEDLVTSEFGFEFEKGEEELDLSNLETIHKSFKKLADGNKFTDQKDACKLEAILASKDA